MVEQPAVQELEVPAGVDPELVDEEAASVLVGAKRLGLATAAVQRHHQLAPEALAKREGGDQRRQDGSRAGMITQCQERLDPILLGGHPQLVQSADGHRGERLEGEVGEGGPAPERQGVVEQRTGPERVAGVERARPSAANRSNR